MMQGMKQSQLERAASVYWAGGCCAQRDPPPNPTCWRGTSCAASTISHPISSFTKADDGRRAHGHASCPTRHGRAPLHRHLRRRPHRRAAPHVRGPGAGASSPTARPASSRTTTAARRGSTTACELPTSASTPSSGGPSTEYGFEPARFDEMRRGAWDIHARVADMDLNGVYASLNFPSFLPGFAGQRLQTMHQGSSTWRWRACGRGTTGTSRSGRARTRTASSRARSRGCSIRSSRAAMIRENAERGFKAVTFTEAPAPARAPDDPHRLLGPVPARRAPRRGRS